MSDVSCVVSAPIIDEVRARHIDPRPLVDGLDVGLSQLEDPRRRFPWPTFVDFAGRATKLLGDDTIEDLAASATERFVPRPIRRVLPRLSDSRPLFLLAPRWWGPFVFRGTRGRCEKLPDGRLREVVEILPGYAACPEFLEGMRGTLRALPRLLGQPDALVTLEHDGREGEFLITPPPRRTRARRRRLLNGLRRRGDRERLVAQHELESLGFVREQLAETERHLALQTKLLEQRAHGLAVLDQLGRALAQREDIEVETLEHETVELLWRHSGAAGVRLSLSPHQADGSHESVAGRIGDGAPTHEWRLQVAEREIGTLALWSDGARAVPTWLETLVPWVAISLEHGASRALVSHLKGLLQQEVRDWERLEQRVEQVVANLGLGRAVEAMAADEATEPEPADLAPFLADLAPRLEEIVGEALELDVADRLWPVLFDERELRSLILYVAAALDEMGSRRIRVEARAVVDEDRTAFGPARARIRIEASGGRLDTVSGGRIRAAVARCNTAVRIEDADLRLDEDGHVEVSLYLPMLTSEAGRLRH